MRDLVPAHIDIVDAVFIVANLAIVAGYLFTAIFVAPLLPVRQFTKQGAVAFFCFCALTHTDQALHTLYTPNERWGEIAHSLHMILIHVPQAVSVWVFAIGFFIDLNVLRRKRVRGEGSGKAES